jgi:3-oxoacyl-[acyl-carrier-protein] synthase II
LFGLEAAIAALRCGHVGALLCGAVDELSERILTDQYMAGLLPGDNAEPPGEGAVVLMLETARHAEARGAKPLAEIRGIACASSGQRLEEVVDDALKQAGIGRDHVGAVCYRGPQALLERLHPAWRGRVLRTAPVAGCLECAQPLLDLAEALRAPGSGQRAPVLAIVATPHAVAGCVVVESLL